LPGLLLPGFPLLFAGIAVAWVSVLTGIVVIRVVWSISSWCGSARGSAVRVHRGLRGVVHVRHPGSDLSEACNEHHG
jgi:hypothetical protein